MGISVGARRGDASPRLARRCCSNTGEVMRGSLSWKWVPGGMHSAPTRSWSDDPILPPAGNRWVLPGDLLGTGWARVTGKWFWQARRAISNHLPIRHRRVLVFMMRPWVSKDVPVLVKRIPPGQEFHGRPAESVVPGACAGVADGRYPGPSEPWHTCPGG